MTSTLNDRTELKTRLSRREPDAIEAFYRAEVPELYAFVFYRVGRDATLAEDAVQETFARALERVSDFDPGRGSWAAWLKTQSRNVVRDLLRDHQRSETLVAMWDRIDAALVDIFAALDSAPLSDEVIERDETRDLVNMTVGELPERYRAVLHRKYVGGETIDAIAESLAVSNDAVKSLLARARRAFRATFETLSQEMQGPTLAEEVSS